MKLIAILIFCFYLLSTLKIDAVQWCEKDIYEAEYHNYTNELEALVIWFPIRAGDFNVLRLCSNQTGLPVRRQCSLNRNGIHATWDIVDKHTKLINCSIIENQCLDEPFVHTNIMRKNTRKSFTNMWPMAKVGERVSPKEPCLLSNGMTLTRKCLYEPRNYTAVWEPIEDNVHFQNAECLKEISQHIVTYDLNKINVGLRETEQLTESERLDAADKVIKLLGTNNTKRISADLEITTEIVEAITGENNNENQTDLVKKVVDIIDLVMKSDENSVRTSAELNAPNRFIYSVDKFLDENTNKLVQCNVTKNGVYYKTANITSVFMINPHCSNISGIAIYNTDITKMHIRPTGLFYDAHTNLFVQFLYLNQSLEELSSQSHLLAAAYFPQALWTHILEESSGKDNVGGIRFSVYKAGYFFMNQNNNTEMPDSVVLSVSIPNYSKTLPNDMPFILSHSQLNQDDQLSCGYWDYDGWNSTGMNTSRLHSEKLTLCKTNHLAHFGILFGLDTKILNIANFAVLTVMDESILNIISIVGCGLSLFGILCIWLTALFFDKWRSVRCNKVVLHLSLVLALMTGCFIFITMTEFRNSFIDIRNKFHCIGMGSFLQYILLVFFTWMLIVAIMQHRRYVVIKCYKTASNRIRMFALTAWGLPILPTAAVAYFDPECYMPSEVDSNSICYPSGYSLYLGVLLPITVIVLANLGIFFYIMCSLRRMLNINIRRYERKHLIFQVKISILLFFLLGLPWLFGLLAHLTANAIFLYIFCVISPLQGFVLFIYSVAADQTTRYGWVKFCCARNYQTMEDTSMTPLTDMNSLKRKEANSMSK